MTLHAFQQALSELVLSPELRTAVADRGADALAVFDLDPRERRRVLSIAEQSGLKAGVLIHRSFRLSMLVRSLPRTCDLLGPRLSDLVHEYWHGHLPLHYNFVWESCRFARFVRERVPTEALPEPWWPDILRVDLASMALRRGLTPEQVDLDPRPGGADLVAAPRGDRMTLRLTHDPRILLADNGTEGPSAVPSGTFQLLLSRRPDGQLDFESV